MIETIKKLGLFGIGVLSLTKEKIEEIADDLEKKGEINSEEGKKLVKEIIAEREKQWKEIEQKINDKFQENIRKSGVVLKEDVQDLKDKIEKLENELEKLSKKIK